MIKSRNVPTVEFLDMLQKEYICAEIRAKIYPRISDKKYYNRVAKGKKDKIIDIASRNSLPHIFTDKNQYRKYWEKVIMEWGYPEFIYNQHINDKKKEFPYKGTIVEILDENRPFQYGVTDWVEFRDKLVWVAEKEGLDPVSFDYQMVRRLTLEETDKMFYYYPGNHFRYKGIDGEIEIGILTNFDYERNLAFIRDEGKEVSYPHKPENIARIL